MFTSHTYISLDVRVHLFLVIRIMRAILGRDGRFSELAYCGARSIFQHKLTALGNSIDSLIAGHRI